MSLFSTSQFASAAASGSDWRDTSKAVLEKLESVRTPGHAFNFGFLYISDHLAADAVSILNLFKSVLHIENWVGGVAIGVCGNGESFVDMPAISALIGRFEPGSFKTFSQGATGAGEEHALEPWLADNDPMLVFVHGNGDAQTDPAMDLRALEGLTGGFMVGGLVSSRHERVHFAGDVAGNGFSGAAFSMNVPVASMLSQGCRPVGGLHTITRCDGQTIYDMDSQKALEVFEEDLRQMAMKKIDKDPNLVLVDEAALYDPSALPEEFQFLFKGEVHAALPISESDQKDYLVRNIRSVDSDGGSMTIAHHVMNGERIMFVQRDQESVYSDLSTCLLELRHRVERDNGSFAPKGAVYISCVARAPDRFDEDSRDEMRLVREVIGDVPLTGFYAAGEICKARLYGYTGILILFL
ncbi:MAG: FIST C-terminal domain-containing protein [Alphaproteobacteria bacterium]|nr:FIST C-terminal domain-containing protein [Alphaproteobacteria bacterium]